MIVILDASTLINLANGEVLREILRLPQKQFVVSGVVRRESRSIAEAIDEAVKANRLGLVDDSLITVGAFKAARQRFQLDDGETECILAAGVMGCCVGCDDHAARKVIIQELGVARLTGSIGLLQKAVTSGLITRTVAFDSYQLMRARGGFLPIQVESDF